MAEGRLVTLIATFIAVVVVLLAAVALIGFLGSGVVDTGSGDAVEGQSPSHYQPDALSDPQDPEDGEITVETDAEPKSILVDTRHSNGFSEEDLEPVGDALFEAGHELNFSKGKGGDRYDTTLERHDALLVINPRGAFKPAEREAVKDFMDDGGRVVVLAEPTQASVGGGLFSSVRQVSFGPEELARAYGFRVGSEPLYNIDDDANDNNFKSIYASPPGSGALLRGVDTVTFDTAGQVIVRNPGETKTLLTAAEGTRTLETRREGAYVTAARNGSMVFVADSDFIGANEVYDADNEVFVGNLLEFLVGGQSTSGGSADMPAEEPTNETADNETTDDGTTDNETPVSETPTPS
ncbi:DUF4350 domain-containing protein [Halomicroarcula sp. GCM10025324]|uniref:DUF4350 domain-containing protein n=1 Tax=Haloarcula TaxID=2237 RepID=UPI0023E7F153|nr:DUF4350 domain-containing protein [Halomicroarcula sp. ZS-22-S1]